MRKLVCYGVRGVEIPFFHKLNTFNYQLTLVEDFLNAETVGLAKGANAVMIRGNCQANEENLRTLSAFGVDTVLTRTVGKNHINISVANELGLRLAYVPAYSPNAIAELAVTLAMMQLRHTALMTSQSAQFNFSVTDSMFSKEVRNCTVGILGVGKIGATAAKLFAGLGAKVIGYDPYPNTLYENVVEFQSFEEVMRHSDIVSIHIPYIPGVNAGMINKTVLALMKEDAILINTSRGELVVEEDVYDALIENKLQSFASDVVQREASVFFKKRDPQECSEIIQKLTNLYPRVLLTPHIGSYTDEALTNMIEISYQNYHDYLTTGECKNKI